MFSGDEVDGQVSVPGLCCSPLCCVTQMGDEGQKRGRGGGQSEIKKEAFH